MTTYIMLVNFTDQGIRGIKDTIKRADAFKEIAKASDIAVKDILWTLGRYDIVATVEAADDMAVTAMGLKLGKGGNVRTETLRAFNQTEMTKILGKVT